MSLLRYCRDFELVFSFLARLLLPTRDSDQSGLCFDAASANS